MSKNLKTMPVTMEDVSFIFNNDLTDFYYSTSHCYCSKCEDNYDSTIINYTIKLNQLYDLELEGSCLNCGNQMGRYVRRPNRDRYRTLVPGIRRGREGKRSII